MTADWPLVIRECVKDKARISVADVGVAVGPESTLVLGRDGIFCSILQYFSCWATKSYQVSKVESVT